VDCSWRVAAESVTRRHGTSLHREHVQARYRYRRVWARLRLVAHAAISVVTHPARRWLPWLPHLRAAARSGCRAGNLRAWRLAAHGITR